MEALGRKVRLHKAQSRPVYARTGIRRLTHTALAQGFDVNDEGCALVYLNPSIPKCLLLPSSFYLIF